MSGNKGFSRLAFSDRTKPTSQSWGKTAPGAGRSAAAGGWWTAGDEAFTSLAMLLRPGVRRTFSVDKAR
jgi:hypothetical protein